MKFLKRALSLLLVLCIAASLVVSAYATEEVNSDEARFQDKTWDEVVREFMTEYNLSENNVAFGYKNMVTGEEHYIAGDTYHVAASMYKVPLNMVFAERISKGEMTFDTEIRGVPYSKLMKGSIVESNNEFSDYLRGKLGGYPYYRDYFLPYIGEEKETVSDRYYANNFFTSRQIITCLDALYQGGEERFPMVLEYMKQSEPNRYFNSLEQDYDVAHKYGYLEVSGKLQINDCGIVYTDDPIAIVAFTLGVAKPYTVLATYCSLMADYTQYHTRIRIEEEERLAAEEAARLAEEEAMAQLDLLALAREGEAGSWTLEKIMADDNLRVALYLTVAVLAVMVLLIFVALIAAARKKAKALSTIGAVVSFALAMLVCVIGPHAGTVITAPVGEPQDVVVTFFDALTAGDYETAYSCLDYYSTLGLEEEPESEAGKLVSQALKDSYSYRLYGECTEDGLTAKQQVLLEHMDVARFQSKLGDKTNDVLREMVQNSPTSSIYDENDQFRPEATDKAYMTAVTSLLEKPELYRTTTGMELDLVYEGEGWKIQVNDALLHALCGGTAY